MAESKGRVRRLVVGCLLTCGPLAAGAQARPGKAVPVPATPYDTTAPDSQRARTFQGCYALVLGAWSNERLIPERVSIAIPTHVMLDTSRLAQPELHSPLAATVRRPEGPDTLPRVHGWSPVGTDSIQFMAFGNQTSTVAIFLRRRGMNVLRGTARFFWDQVAIDPVTRRWLWETYPTANATMTTEPCP
ncbi:MAG: hypothetical protein IT353_08840 [Gemmatimonadaceae bacterium]|nr:hypothetical protein [Gemmatimonadaceae bacterium]